MNKLTFAVTLIASIGLSGCGTTTGERSGSGALMGAAGGALIGAGAGALGGYLYDQHAKGNID